MKEVKLSYFNSGNVIDYFKINKGQMNLLKYFS